MNKSMRVFGLCAALFAFAAPSTQAQESMSFFITSSGPGNGADLGGLGGADQHCQSLAADVGAGERTWRAYLSANDGTNARDRIGSGPWYNALGVEVAADVEQLHGDNNLTKETALDQNGQVVNGRGDSPNRHDILTGSQLDGTAFSDEGDFTCGDWTSSDEGSAQVGHHDRTGGGAEPTSWNSAHGSRGCSQSDLQGTGGDGLFYCFALDQPTDTAVSEYSRAEQAEAFALEGNYPNPFNSGTVIRFALDRAQQVQLAVYNMQGQQLATLVQGMRPGGAYAVQWDGRDDQGRNLASGVYLYRLISGESVETRKLLLLR